jgi:hypothetical protein
MLDTEDVLERISQALGIGVLAAAVLHVIMYRWATLWLGLLLCMLMAWSADAEPGNRDADGWRHLITAAILAVVWLVVTGLLALIVRLVS